MIFIGTLVVVPVRKYWLENNLIFFRFKISKVFNSKQKPVLDIRHHNLGNFSV